MCREPRLIPSSSTRKKKTRAEALSKPSNEKPYQNFDFFALCSISGLIAVRILDFFGEPQSPLKYASFYAMSWLTAFIFGLVLGFVIYRMASRKLNQSGLSLLVLSNVIFLLVIYSPLNWNPSAGWICLGGFFLLQQIVSAAAKFLPLKGEKNDLISTRAYAFGLLFFTLWILYRSLGLFQEMRLWIPGQYIFAVVTVGLLLWALRISNNKEKLKFNVGKTTSKKAEVLLYFGVFLALAYAVINPQLPLDWFHQSFYMGPLADLKAGKTLFIDIQHQYGVLVFYFLRIPFLFMPLASKAFCLFDSVLRVFQYFLFYLIVEKLFGRSLYAFLCLGILLVTNHFGLSTAVTMYPSTGPLRFGFIYILMTLVLFRNTHPQRRKLFWVLEAATAAAAFFWSLDVCVYTLPSYFALIVYEFWATRNKSNFDWKSLIFRVSSFSGFLILIFAMLCLDCLHRSGQWPHWSVYFDYLFSYVSTGYTMLGLPEQKVWWFVLAVLYFSLFSILALTHRNKNQSGSPLNAIFLLSVYGVSQFLYFLGRAALSNLFVISMPAVLLCAFWLYYLRHHPSPEFPSVLRVWGFRLGVFFSAAYLPLFYPNTLEKIRGQLSIPPRVGISCLRQAMIEKNQEDFSPQVVRLMDLYSPGQTRVAYFFNTNNIYLCMDAGRANLYPYCDIDQVILSDLTLQHVLQFDPGLKPGDCVYFFDSYLLDKSLKPGDRIRIAPHPPSKGGVGGESMEMDVLEKIDRQYPLVCADHSGNIVVGKLFPSGSSL